jgi:poly [ADP-ribose] polymerase
MALAGMKFVLTGTMEELRAKVESLIKANGGAVVGGVSKNVTHLLYGPDGKGTTKYIQATEHFDHIKLVTLSEVKEMIDSGSGGGKRKAAKPPAAEPPAKVSRTDSKKGKKAAPAKAKPLEGEVICQTGTFSKTRAEMVELIEDNGATIANTVTKACTLLAYAPDGKNSSKYHQAAGKGVKCVTEQELMAMIDGSAAPVAKEEPEQEKAAARAKPAAAAKSDAAVKPEPEAEPAKSTAKSGPGTQKMTKKGRGVVDVHSGMAETAHIFEEGNDVYQVTLNQTNIGQNNNKFYIIQLLEADAGGKWWVWTRWARVGQVGQSKLEPFGNLMGAKAGFGSKFFDKTRNNWGNRDKFVKVPGKYMLMDMDYGDDDGAEAEASTSSSSAPIPESKLPPRVQDIVKLVSDTKMMTKAMAELEVDVKKMPIGKISKQQIKRGYKVLTRLADAIKTKKSNSEFVALSSEFYTIIPHDFGMRTPPVINQESAILKKMELLDTLADLEIASKLLGVAGGQVTENPIDSAYNKLKCEMVPLDKSSAEYKLLCEYVANTHGKTHTNYKLEVEDILEIKREGEAQRFEPSIGNRHLLWHGSRLSNFMGIISQGLRIAPPEAPVTGYMFGKGVYFADMVTKSANYCHTNRINNTGLMLLADVALGTTYNLTGAKYMEKAPSGYQSTYGQGKMMPNPAGNKDLDGVTVPAGKAYDCTEPERTSGHLLYNEFIVYDVSQINLRYMLKMKFNYK